MNKIEFFNWLKSIDKLDQYEAMLDISEDYAGDQEYRCNAYDDIEKLKWEYSQSIKKIENMKPNSIDGLIEMLTQLQKADYGSLEISNLKIKVTQDMSFNQKNTDIDMSSIKFRITHKNDFKKVNNERKVCNCSGNITGIHDKFCEYYK